MAHVCPRCSEQYAKLANLKRHLKKATECKGSADAPNRQSILSTLDRPRAFSCDICDTKFTSRESLITHTPKCRKKHNVLSREEQLAAENQRLKDQLASLMQSVTTDSALPASPASSSSVTVIQEPVVSVTDSSPSAGSSVLTTPDETTSGETMTPRLFGEEDLQHLKDSPSFNSDMARYIQSVFDPLSPDETDKIKGGDIPLNTAGLTELFGKIYFDPERPWNHTLIYYAESIPGWEKGSHIHGIRDDGTVGWIKVRGHPNFIDKMTYMSGILFREYIMSEFGDGPLPVAKAGALLSMQTLRKFLDIYDQNLYGMQLYPKLEQGHYGYSITHYKDMKTRFMNNMVEFLGTHSLS